MSHAMDDHLHEDRVRFDDDSRTLSKQKVWDTRRPVTASGDAVVIRDIPAVAHGFSIGDIVYGSGAGWAKARADLLTTSGYTGMASKVSNPDKFDLTLVGRVNDTAASFSPGSLYYLSAVAAGAATLVGSLAADARHVPVLLALDTNSVYLFATSMIGEDLSRMVLGDVTDGGGSLQVNFGATKGVLNLVVADFGADNPGEIKWRKFTFCDPATGTNKTCWIPASALV